MRTAHAPTLRRHQPSSRTRPTHDVPPGWVARTELVQGLIDAQHAPLALIVAPPGYGKSTLLREWAEHDQRHFVWLTPAQAEHLALTVRRIRHRQSSFVVVVDNAHLVEPEALRVCVDAALHELPHGSTVALASRAELGLSVGRLRAHRLLAEVRVAQLAMDCSAGATLLRQMGVERDLEEVRALVDRTEGWPVALYLAALALCGDPDGLSSLDGQHHVLSEYLNDEVLDAMPDDLLAFAIRTSVLDELSGPVCDVLLDTGGSALVLDRLARTNPLLIAVDPAHRRYRWHTLVREALVDRLARSDLGLERTLHLRASEWCSEHDDVAGAIDHAAAAGDARLTGALLWRNILAYVTCGQRALVDGWLGRFGSDTIASHPSLALSASFSALASGELHDAQRLADVAAAGLERCKRRRQPGSLHTGLAVIESIGAHDGPTRMGELALAAAEAEPRDSPWRGVCLVLRATATYLCGDRASAEPLLDESIRVTGTTVPAFAALSVAQRTMVAIEADDWDVAAELTDRAAMMVEEWGLASDPFSVLSLAAAAASRAHDGRIDEAKHDLRRGSDLLASLGDFVPWYGAQARILLAHASLSLADAIGARTLLAEASRFARKTPGAVVFSSWFDRAWAQMDTLAETSLAGPSSLTIAELRILRFLPSHRSFREIAVQLGVSSNTVKTQAHAVYRKLGAASRSEAVAQATEAGLLGG